MDKQNKNPRKLDLLEMSDSERVKLIEEIRAKLQQNVAEAKLCQSLLQTERLTVNRNMVYGKDDRPSGFFFQSRIQQRNFS